jgi:hypothetical protein
MYRGLISGLGNSFFSSLKPRDVWKQEDWKEDQVIDCKMKW